MYFCDQGNQTTSTHDRAVLHAGLYKGLYYYGNARNTGEKCGRSRISTVIIATM